MIHPIDSRGRGNAERLAPKRRLVQLCGGAPSSRRGGNHSYPSAPALLTPPAGGVGDAGSQCQCPLSGEALAFNHPAKTRSGRQRRPRANAVFQGTWSHSSCRQFMPGLSSGTSVAFWGANPGQVTLASPSATRCLPGNTMSRGRVWVNWFSVLITLWAVCLDLHLMWIIILVKNI